MIEIKNLHKAFGQNQVLKGVDITVDAAKAKKKEIHEIRLRTAMVFQNYNLFANKTALGNVMEGLTQARGVSKEKAKEIALDALEKVGLKDKADY